MLTSSPTAELEAELKGLLRDGVTHGALVNCPELLGLELVAARSASDSAADLAVSANHLIREGATRVDGTAGGPAARLLGVAPGRTGSKLTTRREEVSEMLFLSVDHFRKEREPKLVRSVAEALVELDSAFRLRHQHRIEGERRPEESRLQINWLAQHRSYRRIWTPVEAMKNDLIWFLQYLRGGGEEHFVICDRLCNITWRYAQFQTELAAFVEREGGLWLLADPDSEIQAADAIYRLGFHTPLGEADESWLRLLLSRSEAGELEPFTDLLIEAGERRQELMASWMRWVEGCEADPAEPDPGCEVHLWLEAAKEFVRLLDEDWYRVADWYRQ